MRALAFFTLWLAALLTAAAAEETGTVDQFLGGFLAISDLKCKNKDDTVVKRFESQGKRAEAYSIKSAETTICECMPAQARRLRASLSKEERMHVTSETEFSGKYLPEIVNKCAADQLRSTYSGDCPDRFARFNSNSAGYCSCMSNKLGELSDGEIAAMGKASSDYLPLAAEAKNSGLPKPEEPAAFKQFTSIHAICAKP